MNTIFRILRLLCVPTLAFLGAGCGTTAFVPPQSQPVLSKVLKATDGSIQAMTLATTAERREVIFRAKDGRTCFEAPPDAADAVASQFSGAFQAGVKKGTLDANTSASLGTSVSNAIASLAKRSQGVILYRDAAFNICLAWLNGSIDDKAYSDELGKLVAQVIPLIGSEITATNGKIGPDLTIVSNPAASPVSQVQTGKPTTPATPTTPTPPTTQTTPGSTDGSPAVAQGITTTTSASPAQSRPLQLETQLPPPPPRRLQPTVRTLVPSIRRRRRRRMRPSMRSMAARIPSTPPRKQHQRQPGPP
jgi:hypothetical protein